MTTPTPNMEDETHAAGCTGCHPGDDAGHCHGCGHWRDDIWDYSHGYYCTNCRLAIQHWREAEAEMIRLGLA